MHILAIVGSPRLDGNTNYLVDEALNEAAKLGATTEKIVVSQHKLSPCLAHANCRHLDACLQKDDASWILDKFSAADGVILATPVYYYDVSAWLKIFIDRNYFLGRHGKKCRAKSVGIIVVAGGALGIEDTVNALHRFIKSSSFEPIAESNKFVVSGIASGPKDTRSNEELTGKARDMGRHLVASLTQ